MGNFSPPPSSAGYTRAGVIAVAIGAVVLLGGIGALAFAALHKPAAAAVATASSTDDTSGALGTSCALPSDTTAGDSGPWTTLTSSQVDLTDWGVTLTLPQSLVGKAVCREDANGYYFSLAAAVAAPSCVNEYDEDELGSVGLQVVRYSSDDDAQDQIQDAQGSLADYYNANKVSGGNYFADTSVDPARDYYSVGDYFYVGFGDTASTIQQHHDARVSACPGVDPDFQAAFVSAIASVKAD